MSIIKHNCTILFQGDSVTDADRSREDDAELGFGYPMMIDAWLSASHPDRSIRVLNRGISGNKSRDLVARWKEDCIDLKPDVVSILVGINDTWHGFNLNDPTSTEEYAANYRKILEWTRSETDAAIVMLEPFVLPIPEDRIAWRLDLDPKIHAMRALAREFGTILVPLDGIFAAASAQREPLFWTPDGVHPSQAGHALIAQSWLRAVRER
jgi:acyl-CoA thioesterase I